MSSETELAEAVERLRRVKAGESPADVYGTAGTVSHLGSHGLAMRRLWRDQGALADAYLALGTRQPDVYAVYLPPGVTMRDESLEAIRRDFPRLRGIVREVTFIQEIPEVPNAD